MMKELRERLRSFQDFYPAIYPGKATRDVTFIVTHDCDLRCSYCYEHHKGGGRMDFETAKKCVDMLFREDARGSDYINGQNAHGLVMNFIGGEPLLEIGLIGRIMDYFRAQAVRRRHRWATRYMIAISTNGMHYFDPGVRRFLNENEGRVSMSVTLDGDKETHDACRLDCGGCGSYDRAAAAFGDICRRYRQEGTKFTIAPGNVDRVFIACRDMIERFGLKSLFCNCVYEEGWEEEHGKILYEQLKLLADWLIDSGREVDCSIFDPFIGKPLPENETQNWCGGTGKMLAFDIDGTVLPCMRYSPLSVGEKRPVFRIGDCENGIGALTGDKENVERLNRITRQSQSPEKCLTCPVASGCGWCSAYHYELWGTPDKRATFICPMHKARVLAAAYYHNRRALMGKGEAFPVNLPEEEGWRLIGEGNFREVMALAEKAEKLAKEGREYGG